MPPQSPNAKKKKTPIASDWIVIMNCHNEFFSLISVVGLTKQSTRTIVPWWLQHKFYSFEEFQQSTPDFQIFFLPMGPIGSLQPLEVKSPLVSLALTFMYQWSWQEGGGLCTHLPTPFSYVVHHHKALQSNLAIVKPTRNFLVYLEVNHLESSFSSARGSRSITFGARHSQM
jgi:hypothetical protein